MNDTLAKLIDLRAIEPLPDDLFAQALRYADMPIEVTDNASFEEAVQHVRDIKAMEKELETEEKRAKAPLQLAINGIRDSFGQTAKLLATARFNALSKTNSYSAALEQERRAEQARLDQIAAKEKARLERAAERAAEKGNYEKAAVLEQQAAAPTPRPMAPAPPKAQGVSTRDVWKFEYTDRDKVPREYCSPDDVKIGAVVRALKAQHNIPGVRVWVEQTNVVRGS